MTWCNQWCATRISFRPYPVCYLYLHFYWGCKVFRLVFVYNFNLLYKRLVRSHIGYDNIVWSPFQKADSSLIENIQIKATDFIPEINKLDYQERLEMLNLPTLAYREFRCSTSKTNKILHSMYDTNCTNSLFELKESNTCGHKLQLKQNYQEPALDEIFLV